MNTIVRIKEFIKEQRKYASFFEWFRREKQIKEIGIVQSLLETVSKDDLLKLSNLRPSENDPPDCIAETAEGLKVGFEVRELVDQKSIELNEKGQQVYRDWRPPEVVQEIQKIINEKDAKKYLGGPYGKLILTIPTAEPVLTFDELKPALEAHTFEKTENITDAFLVFQYDPATKSYPYIKLKIAANRK